MEKKKKSNKIGTILIAVIMLIIGAVGCYTFLTLYPQNENTQNKVNVENKKTNSSTEKDTCYKSVDITDSEVTSLYNRITNASSILGQKIEDYYKANKVTVNDLNKDTVKYIAIYQISGDDQFSQNKDLTAEKLRNKITQLFGKNYTYKDETFGGCNKYIYDGSTKIYTYQAGGCGGSSYPTTTTKIAKAEKNDKEINIYIRVLFISADGMNPFKYYKDVNRTIEVKDFSKTNDGYLDETEISNYHKGNLYKFTFTKEDNNYIFTSSEPVNE